MKKFISACLLLSIVVATVLVSIVPASAETYNAYDVVDVAYNHANSGKSWPSNMCLYYVRKLFEEAYGGNWEQYSSCCAYHNGNKYIDSSSRSDIPLGACIYFSGSNVICSNGGECGHIAVYVGDGKIVHAWGAKIICTTISYVENCGYKYRGYGWFGNITLTDKHIKQFYPTHCTIQLSKSGYVKSMPCSADTDPESENIEYYTAGGTYTAIGLCRNDASETGNLWYKVVAKTGEIGYLYAGDTKLGADNILRIVSDLKVTGVSAPTELTQGKSFSIKGVVKTDYQRLTKVGAVVINSATGAKVTGTVLSVDATSYDLLNSNVDYAVKFNDLPVGTYEYRIVASVKSYYAETATQEASATTAELVLHRSTFSVVASTSCSHSYNTSVTAPTCTAEGYTTYTCKSCGYSYKGSYTAAKGHSYGNWVTVTAATCTKAGQEKSTCSSCGNVKTQTVAAGGHQYAANKVAATCTEYAKTVYTCSGCGDSYTKYDESQYSQWSTTKPSGIADKWVESRTEYRYRTKEYTTGTTSTMDGWNLKDTTTQWSEYGAWSGWSDTAVTASDTVKVEKRTVYAYYFYKCSHCGAHMHGYGSCYTWAGGCGKSTSSADWNQIWSTTSWDNAGLKDWHGTGKYYTNIDGQLVFKHTSGGSKTQYRSCTRTLETVYNFWRWSDWSNWQTTAVESTDERAVETRTVYRYLNSGLAAHTEVSDKAVAATCTAAGKTEGKHCSVCNTVLVAQTTVAATGHSYTYKATKNPTTSATGTLTGTCAKCSGTTTVSLPKLNTTDYTYQVTKAATCTATGTGKYTWKTTTYGSFSFSVTIAATGHTEVIDKAVAATCTAAGKTEGKHCSVCNTVLVAQTTVAATGHSYTYKATKNPTASATGTLTGTCSKCSGTTTVSLPKLNTTDYTYQVTKAATCTATGTGKYTWKTTTYGSLSFNVTISATGHTEVTDAAVAATCTTAGKTEGKHCSVCNAIIVAQTTVAAKGHTEVIDKAVAATCTTAGKTEGKHCSVCNAIIVAQTTVAAKGHTEVIDKAVAATCTTSGKTEGKHCSVCNTVIVAQQTIAAKGHTEVIDKAVAATCTTSGKTEGKHCSVCNAIIVAQTTVAAKGHTEVIDKAVAATCTTSGKTEGKHCSVCGTVIKAQTTIAAKGHTEVIDKAVAATCTAAGKTEGKHCSVCGTVLVAQQTIPASNHNYAITPEVKPTCTKPGMTSGVQCTDCGTYLLPGNEIPALGHTVVIDPAVDATCNTPGKTEGSHCSVCNEILVAQQELPVTSHSYAITPEVKPTCTEPGYTSGVQCSLCKEYLLPATEVPALGHTEVIDPAVDAACTAAGLTEGKHCSVCNEVLIPQEEIPAVGHNFENGICTGCGEKDAAAIRITQQPAAQTAEYGGNAVFTVVAEGENLTYRWQYSKDGGMTWNNASTSMTGYNTKKLTLAATAARNGYMIRCKLTDSNGNTLFSDAVLFTCTEPDFSFTKHPADETVKLGNRAAFTVKVDGDVKAYQWQYQMVENGPWWNCTAYTMGYNTTELNVIAAEKRQGFLYRCRATDSSGNKYYSNPAELTVDIPTSYAVLSQPKNTWVMPGKTTTFHIDTQGEGLKFQWEYHKGVDKTGPEYYWIAMGSTTGCKTDTLTIAGISGSTNRDGWAYRCVVTDPNGYVYTTDHAFLYVTTAQITSQPKSVTAAAGDKAVFQVKVTGEVTSYQWQYSKDGGKSWYNSSSATQGYNTGILTVGATAARNGFMYRCIIIDGSGNRIESCPVTLTVK